MAGHLSQILGLTMMITVGALGIDPSLRPALAQISDCHDFLSRFPNHRAFFQSFTNEQAESADRRFREYVEGTRGLYVDLETIAPDFKLYHGSWERSRVDAIVERGFIPGSGGQIFPSGQPYSGVYVVAKRHMNFARDFVDRTAGGAVLELDIDPNAKVVDFRKALSGGFVEDHFGNDYNRFFSQVPVDIFIYDYPVPGDEVLMVIRNSRVIRDIRVHQNSINQ